MSVKVICFSQFDWLLIPLCLIQPGSLSCQISSRDGCDLESNPQIEVHLEFADFDSDPSLSALLTDFRIAEDPAVARLSYIFRKKEEVDMGLPRSGEDCEFIVFGKNPVKAVEFAQRRGGVDI
ncbi:hypothetical protein [Enterobacter cloacae complex sp. 358K9]|uniref:hypothetical protein n=1 Tax=Enterobacter cloacae complex sp. 358K9 TaxID=3395826 RepID=UPI003CF57C52